MAIATEELPGGITSGDPRWQVDIGAGAAAVDLPMNAIAAGARVLVDLQKVSFLGSMGLRALVGRLPARSKAAEAKSFCLGRTNRSKGFGKPAERDTLIPISPRTPRSAPAAPA